MQQQQQQQQPDEGKEVEVEAQRKQKQARNAERLLEVATSTPLMRYLGWRDMSRLSSVSKVFRPLLSPEEENDGVTWRMMCESLAAERALYLPGDLVAGDFHRTFFEQLWPARNKWRTEEEQQQRQQDQKEGEDEEDQASAENFNIRVAVRFRPGVRKNEQLTLPLHQYLKMRRAAENESMAATAAGTGAGADDEDDNNKENTSGAFSDSALMQGGKGHCPSELLDAMTGNIMRSPVRLPDSGRIMDRETVEHCLDRDPHDPFTGAPLTIDMVEECPALRAQLREWEQENPDRRPDYSVSVEEVQRFAKQATGGVGTVSPAVFELLVAAEQLECGVKRAEQDALDPYSVESGRSREQRRQRLLAMLQFAREQMRAGGHGAGENGALTADEQALADGLRQLEEQAAAALSGGPLEPAERRRHRGFSEEDEDWTPVEGHDARRGLGEVPPWQQHRRRQQQRARLLAVDDACVTMHVPGAGLRPFPFHRVFDYHATQETIFEECARDAVVSMLNGYNSCLLCYGQTGSGKTHTMFGPSAGIDAELNASVADAFAHHKDLPVDAGVVPRTCVELFTAIDAMRLQSLARARALLRHRCHPVSNRGRSEGGKTEDDDGDTDGDKYGSAERWEAEEDGECELTPVQEQFLDSRVPNCTLHAEFVEIYQDEITCLLSGQPARISREKGELVGATRAPLDSLADVLEVLRTGNLRKRFGATAMNERSSRAHTIFIVHAVQAHNGRTLNSRLTLVDLAGSERVKKSKAVGQRLVEAVGINTSLLVLGKCISALVESAHHVPYFESTLTTLLKSAFGGNSRTTAIVTCRSDDEHGDETLQALRFGERSSLISNQTKMAATSVEAALSAIDQALDTCEASMASLTERDLTHLPSFRKLREKYDQLSLRRRELQRTVLG